MINKYVKVPEDWADTRDGIQYKENVLKPVDTLYMGKVVAATQLKEFPITFKRLELTGWPIEVIELDNNEFPQPENII